MTTSDASSTPTTTASPAAPHPPRSLAPDIARGLMLALIAIANVSWLLWGHEGSVGMTPHVPARSGVDTAVQVVITVAVDHRAMPLFAFLFGYGMVQFHRSRIDRGIEPRIVRVMLRRRHWALLLLGFLHAALLFFGDILGAYAVAGLVLVWLFFGRRTRTLIVWASVIGGVMVLYALFSTISALVLAVAAPPEVLAQMGASAMPYSNAWLRDLSYAQSYPVTILARSGIWVVTLLGAALMSAPLPILLGWIAARRRLLDEPWHHVRLLRRLAVGIAIGWLTGLPEALVIAGVIPLPDAVSWGFMGLNVVGGICCGVGYAAAFGLLAAWLEHRPTNAARPEQRTTTAGQPEQRTPTAGQRRLPRTVAAVGRRSLTFYLFQSLLLAPLMASWGLGLAPHLSTASAVAIAAGVWLVSLPLAAWMEARGMRGPAELLLRRMTYGKHDPALER